MYLAIWVFCPYIQRSLTTTRAPVVLPIKKFNLNSLTALIFYYRRTFLRNLKSYVAARNTKNVYWFIQSFEFIRLAADKYSICLSFCNWLVNLKGFKKPGYFLSKMTSIKYLKGDPMKKWKIKVIRSCLDFARRQNLIRYLQVVRQRVCIQQFAITLEYSCDNKGTHNFWPRCSPERSYKLLFWTFPLRFSQKFTQIGSNWII